MTIEQAERLGDLERENTGRRGLMAHSSLGPAVAKEVRRRAAKRIKVTVLAHSYRGQAGMRVSASDVA